MRLINADELLTAFPVDDEPTLTKSCVRMTIKNMPTIEPEQRWIPCSERMPEYPFGCLVTVWDTNPITMDEFESILPYFVGWDGEQWNDGEGDQCPFEVIAWLPIPEPFKEDHDD